MNGMPANDWRTQDWPNKEAVKYLSPPDGTPDHMAMQSPGVIPFKDPLFVPPVKEAESAELTPRPDPRRHQRYHEFEPNLFYTVVSRSSCGNSTATTARRRGRGDSTAAPLGPPTTPGTGSRSWFAVSTTCRPCSTPG